MFVRMTAVCLTFAFAACKKDSPVSVEPAEPAAPVAQPATADAVPTDAAPAATADAHVHNVACGCSLGQKCSNMIEVDGEYVPLTGDLGLGEMEFCGKKGLKAEVQGEMKEGSFVATAFELVE